MTDNVLFQDNGSNPGDQLTEANLARTVTALVNSDATVASGLSVTYDTGSDEIDIGAGLATIITSGGDGYVVDADARTGLSPATTTGINYVFLQTDLTAENAISVHIDSSDTAPSDPSIKIAEADASDGSVTEFNRFSAGPGVDVEDDGTTTVADTQAINFNSGLSVSDDGDETVTVTNDNTGDTKRLINFERGELETGNYREHTISVADGETLEIERWAALTTSDTTPANLKIQLTEPSGTVISEESTDLSTGAPITSTTNSSGGVKQYRIRIENTTGTDYITGSTPEGVYGEAVYDIA